ncbi:MAG: GTPase [Thermoguttaceae bacterium]
MTTITSTPTDFAKCGDVLRRLDVALERLVCVATEWGVASPAEQPWWTLLHQKLLPQLAVKPLLVVAVMGGTNTGKSLLFNHLVGEAMSGVDPCAAGTKHPVCAVPKSLEQETSLAATLQHYFGTFKLAAWDSADDSLKRDATPTLFWRTVDSVPDRLLLLDTPDIDSDTMQNWERAECVGQVADLIVAVLTPEKYNDAAIKKFFRETAASQKQVILLFNRVMDDDLPHIASWLVQFKRETGIDPIRVVTVPFDRDAAATQTLPFCVPNLDGTNTSFGEKIDLRDELSNLHFDKIKTQTLRGALARLVEPRDGLPSYLESIRHRARLYRDARDKLLAVQDEMTTSWPVLAPSVLTAEVQRWWDARRPAWSQTIHAGYQWVGKKLCQIPRYVFGGRAASVTDPEVEFRRAEEVAISRVVEQTMSRLDSLRRTENSVLRDEVERLVSGDFRERLVRESQAMYAKLPQMSDSFRSDLTARLDAWASENPDAVRRREFIDNSVAVARPLVTAALLVTGGVGAAYILHETIISVAGATMSGALGEAALYKSGERATASFANLFADSLRDWTRQRVQHFYDWFNERLWREIVTRLDTGSKLADSDEFLEVKRVFESL